jgi:hypothetical protein
MATAFQKKILQKEVQHEIERLSRDKRIDSHVLEDFADFIIQNCLKANKKPDKSLKITDLKRAVYDRFSVNSTKELKESWAFKMATDGMVKLDFRTKKTWEMLYRKFIDILPNERNQQGYGCINGVNIFKYFKPWQVFGLDRATAKKEDIKRAYYKLSKIYHPDIPKTGDRKIFEEIERMYKSIIAGEE